MPIRDDDGSDTFSELVPQVLRDSGALEIHNRLVRAKRGVPYRIIIQARMEMCS